MRTNENVVCNWQFIHCAMKKHGVSGPTAASSTLSFTLHEFLMLYVSYIMANALKVRFCSSFIEPYFYFFKKKKKTISQASCFDVSVATLSQQPDK